MAFGGNNLHDGLSSNVLVEVLRDHHRNRHVLLRLDDVAGDADKIQNVSHIALKYCPRHHQPYVGPHVEQRSTKLLHRHRLQVSAHSQRSEPAAPRFVIRRHSIEQLVQLFLLKPSIVIHVVQIPEKENKKLKINTNKLLFAQ